MPAGLLENYPTIQEVRALVKSVTDNRRRTVITRALNRDPFATNRIGQMRWNFAERQRMMIEILTTEFGWYSYQYKKIQYCCKATSFNNPKYLAERLKKGDCISPHYLLYPTVFEELKRILTLTGYDMERFEKQCKSEPKPDPVAPAIKVVKPRPPKRTPPAQKKDPEPIDSPISLISVLYWVGKNGVGRYLEQY